MNIFQIHLSRKRKSHLNYTKFILKRIKFSNKYQESEIYN